MLKLDDEHRRTLSTLWLKRGRDDTAREAGVTPDEYARGASGEAVDPDTHARLTRYALVG